MSSFKSNKDIHEKEEFDMFANFFINLNWKKLNKYMYKWFRKSHVAYFECAENIVLPRRVFPFCLFCPLSGIF